MNLQSFYQWLRTQIHKSFLYEREWEKTWQIHEIQNKFFLEVTSRHRDSFLEPTVTSQLKSEVKCEVICFRGVRAEPTMLFV